MRCEQCNEHIQHNDLQYTYTDETGEVHNFDSSDCLIEYLQEIQVVEVFRP